MGTRSTIKVKEENKKSKTIVNIYCQYDGYLEGVGMDLYNTFGHTKLLNGFNTHTAPAYANGMECLAAQVVASLKKGIGNVYLMPERCMGMEEYNYILYAAEKNEHGEVTAEDFTNTVVAENTDELKKMFEYDNILSLKVTDCMGKVIYDDYLFRFKNFVNSQNEF